MRFLIILVAMVVMSAGAWHSYQKRNLLIQAALLSEGFTLSKSVKSRVLDFYIQHNVMPHDNASAELPPPTSIYGTSVKRVSVNRSGVVMVDFDDEIGRQNMVFSPTVSPVTGVIEWSCSSDSIDPKVLDLLKPKCGHAASSSGGQLINAIANGKIETVQQLLDAGTNPDVVVNGNTPLMLAAKTGHLEIVSLLLKKGASVDNNALNSERRTPLMVAINSNHADVVSHLLSSGASVTRRDYKGLSAQDHAVKTDRRLGGERYELMVLAKLNPRFAGSAQDKRTKKRSKAKQAKHMDALYVELVQATLSCRVKRIASLLREENDFKSSETYLGKPLSTYIKKPECVDQLQAYLKTKQAYQSALHTRFASASASCDKKKIDNMIRRNPELDILERRGEYSHFENSIFSGCTELVSYFIREGKLKNQIDGSILLNTIKKAPREKQVEFVGSLIEAGVDVNVSNSNGDTPLGLAISHERPVVAKYLVDAGADVNAPTAQKSYPIIEASKKGYNHLVSQMINEGAAINQKDTFGRTAIVAAVAKGRRRLVDTLLRSGANATLKDKDGISAVMLAESKNYKQIFSQLTASASNDY